MDVRRRTALAVPAVVPLAMTAVFAAASRRLDPARAYVVGFVAYWLTCVVASVAVLGPRRAVALLRNAAGPPTPVAASTAPGGLRRLLLAWPVAGAVATRLLPGLRTASATDVLTIATVAAANATAEELLWRGVFVALWPEDPVRGWLWPAVGFGAWHLAPQVCRPSPMGRMRYAGASLLLGLSWGRVAFDARSLRPALLSHLLTDGSGIENAKAFEVFGGSR